MRVGNGIKCEECEMFVAHNNKFGRLSQWDMKKAAIEDRDFAQVAIGQLDVDQLYVIPWEET